MKIVKMILSGLSVISVFLISIAISVFISPLFGGFSFVLLGLTSFVLIKYIKIVEIESRFRFLLTIVVTVILAFSLGLFSKEYFNAKLSNVSYVYELISYIGFSFLLLIPAFKIVHLYFSLILAYKRKKNSYLVYLFGLVTLGYMFFIQFPSDVFFSNPDEFIFSYQILLRSEVPVLLLAIAVAYFVLTLLPPCISEVINRIVVSLSIGCYVQYMFFNKGMGLVDGGTYRWTDNKALAYIDIAVWLCLIITMLAGYIKFKKKIYKFDIFIYVLLLFMMISSLITNIINAPKEAFSNKTYQFTTDDEFVLSPNGNVIVFIIDEVDNMYIDEILDNDKEFFDDFNDFTLYDNTCCVYDFTATSKNQLFTGYCFGDTENHIDECYQRIKDEGYMVNFYSFQGYSEFPDIYPYIDNCKEIYLGDNDCRVDYQNISSDFIYMSLYQAYPNVLKDSSKVNSLVFNHIFLVDKKSESYFENEDFFNHMHFSLADNPEKRFIEYHIRGAHFPCDNHVETIKYCLSIGKEMVAQLKELGVYDNSCIIIMSDHGLHDQSEYYTFPTAGTPLFMIKEFEKSDINMKVSNAPIYYKDFMPTILYNMGLFEGNEDREKFGTPIYDYNDGEKRSRKWYDSDSGGYRVYTYEGDYEELKRVVNEGNYTFMER